MADKTDNHHNLSRSAGSPMPLVGRNAIKGALSRHLKLSQSENEKDYFIVFVVNNNSLLLNGSDQQSSGLEFDTDRRLEK
jgi:hypothetical protein